MIDPSKPYVYLIFDHIGKREPISKHEPATGIWLRLVNNCRVPVIIATFDPGTGDPGLGVYDEIISVPANGPSVRSPSKAVESSEEQPPEGYPHPRFFRPQRSHPGEQSCSACHQTMSVDPGISRSNSIWACLAQLMAKGLTVSCLFTGRTCPRNSGRISVPENYRCDHKSSETDSSARRDGIFDRLQLVGSQQQNLRRGHQRFSRAQVIIGPSDTRAMTLALLRILLFDRAVSASECQIIVDGRNVPRSSSPVPPTFFLRR